MKKTARLVVLVVLVSLCAIGVVLVRVLLGPNIEGPLFQDIRPVPISELSADRFMHALKEENYQRAYEMLAPHLKREMGNVEDFQSSLLQSGVDPKSWHWTSSSDSTGIVNGEVTMKDGTQASGTLILATLLDDGSVVVTEYRFSRN